MIAYTNKYAYVYTYIRTYVYAFVRQCVSQQTDTDRQSTDTELIKRKESKAKQSRRAVLLVARLYKYNRAAAAAAGNE